MEFTCNKCDKKFEFEKGCNVSYEGIRCKECNTNHTNEVLERAKKREEQGRNTVYNFKPFFDQSLGINITSQSHKKEIEREHGVTYVSNDERIAAQREAKRHVQGRKKAHVRKNIEQIMNNVHKGHSYINDLKREGLC